MTPISVAIHRRIVASLREAEPELLQLVFANPVRNGIETS